MASKISIKERGPEVCAPAPLTNAPLGAEGRELVTDAAAGLERQTGLVHRAQDAVHRVRHDARYRAVDGRGRRLVRQRAGVGRHAARGDGAVVERPEEFCEPLLALLGHGLDVRERARHANVGVLDGLVEGSPDLVLRRYFLSQMSYDAGCRGISTVSGCSAWSFTASMYYPPCFLIVSGGLRPC